MTYKVTVILQKKMLSLLPYSNSVAISFNLFANDSKMGQKKLTLSQKESLTKELQKEVQINRSVSK